MRWDQPDQPRDQLVLFTTTLDDALPGDHVVRLLDEILGRLDWADWEATYHGRTGRPPIHPRVLAGVLLYGLLTRIRSSRSLEDALRTRMDFRWLASGRSIDHTTLSEFRRGHPELLKGLFIRVVQVARDMGLVSFARLGFDGTRVGANNRPTGTRTPDQLRAEREELAAQFREQQRLADEEDAREAALIGDASTHRLPADCRDAAGRLERLDATLEALRRVEQEEGGKPPKRVPSVDPDARVMPNKQGGGFAPNYTPTATVDIDSGLIVGAEVLNVINEDASLIPSVEAVCRDFELEAPPVVLADGLIGTAANLAGCAERGIDLYSPCAAPIDPATNPAVRPDPTTPVAEGDRGRLPTEMIGGKPNQVERLSKEAFAYDAEKDCYFCPMGKELPRSTTTREASRSGGRVRSRYKASRSDCEACPLRSRCLTQAGGRPREISREANETYVEAHARKMAKAEAQEIYKSRRHPGERPFGVIKHHFGLRQFLLRGREAVSQEWRWAATAFNLQRLMGLVRNRAGPGAEASRMTIQPSPLT